MKNFIEKFRQTLCFFLMIAVFLMQASTANARILFQNEVFENDGETFLIDADADLGSGSNLSLQFGSTINENLRWNTLTSNFELTDDIVIDGGVETNANIDLNLNEIVEGRIENLAVAPACNAASSGRVYMNTTDDTPYMCNGSSWVSLVSAGSLNNTLDQAYDQNGAGAGKDITADSGAVTITGDGLVVDNIDIDNNTISSIDTDGNIVLNPNGNGTINLGADVNVTGNNLTMDFDDTGGDIKLTFGQTLNEFFAWDNTNSRFNISDSLQIDGDAAVIGTTYIADNHSITDSDGVLSLGINDSAWETFEWDDANSTFTMSDDLNVTDNLTVDDNVTIGGNSIFGDASTDTIIFNSFIQSNFVPTVDLGYDLGSQTKRWNVIYANSIETGGGLGDDINFGESGLSFDFTNGQSTYVNGRTFTIESGDVLKVNATGVEEVILAQSKNDSPIGVAVNDTNFGETVRIIILGKSVIHCIGLIDPGETIQTSNTIGYAAAGVNSTKVIGTALTACIGGTVDAVVHLE